MILFDIFGCIFYILGAIFIVLAGWLTLDEYLEERQIRRQMVQHDIVQSATEVQISEALELQIPKKVKLMRAFEKNKKAGYCPNCRQTVEIRNTFPRRYRRENHCTWCGQFLDWNGTLEAWSEKDG